MVSRLFEVIALRQLSSTASAPADAAAIVAKDVQEQNSAIISAREKLVIIMVRFFFSCVMWIYAFVGLTSASSATAGGTAGRCGLSLEFHGKQGTEAARRSLHRLARCFHGLAGCSGALTSSAATICHLPFRRTHVSVQT